METRSRICYEEMTRVALVVIIVRFWSSLVKQRAGRAGRGQRLIMKDLFLKNKEKPRRNPGWLAVVRGSDNNNIKTWFHRQRTTL